MIKITFGVIALNALPLLEYNLRALYPFAHQIIVVEGATRAAVSLSRPDGHSRDGTLEMLLKIKNEIDGDEKIKVVSATEEGYTDGFWPEKDEMSRAYAKRATGNWLWQVDSDEFYREEDIRSLAERLETDPTITTVSFPYTEFFGGFSSTITGVWHLYDHPRFHRLFQWKKGYVYKTHRPPTVVDQDGIDLRLKNWLRNPRNGRRPIFLYHYSYVFPRQAQQKVGYYSNVEWTDAFQHNYRWMQEEYFGLRHPMFLGERGWPNLQWLEDYSGAHPAAIRQLQIDLAAGKIREPVRSILDIEYLVHSPIYIVQRAIARVFLLFYWPIRLAWKRLRVLLVSKTGVI